ncbi:MAG TPA: outer membrane beta-barrel protein [Ohtaekwangia sp.]|nr:outer membrane beta-barrel protein [Ohtaekwangia sp.]
MERRKFEEGFKDAFKDAEVSPSENVWTNIELDITRAEGGKMKQRLLFYKLLAAASITFALCMVGVDYYSDNKGIEVNEIALSENTVQGRSRTNGRAQTENSVRAIDSATPSVVTESAEVSPEFKTEQTPTSTSPSTTFIGSENYHVAASDLNDENTLPDRNASNTLYTDKSTPFATDGNSNVVFISPDENFNDMADRPLPSLYTSSVKHPQYVTGQSVADPVALMFARLKDLERELSGEKKDKKSRSAEQLWTSVGFSAGSFNSVNPNVSPPSNQTMARTNQTVNRQAKASGTAYSLGISVGTKLAERWVIQGGVNYLTQLSDYTTDEAIGSSNLESFKAASLNEFKAGIDNKVISTAPYTVNTSVRFISVPVQAGYLIVNKKVNVLLNAGVSTDMFLQNTVDPEGNGLETTTQGHGDDSPYRALNFSGLVGTELSYRFADRYRLSLNPGLRYPFNSIYKDNVGVDATPLTFDIGLRFRYIFK